MKRVIFNKKGGVGKTSIACNLAAIAAASGRKTLVIDLDAQCNATQYLLGELRAESSIVDYLSQNPTFFSSAQGPNEYVYKTAFDNLFIIPASETLPDIEHKLESRYKIYKIRDALEELANLYDDIYIDTPPALNFFTKSALIATDRVLIPFDCDAFSRQSVEQVSNAIYDICEDHNPDLVIEGIVVNQFQPRAKLPGQLVESLKTSGFPVLPVALNSSVKMRESHQYHKPLVYLAPKHPLTQQFTDLYHHIQSTPVNEHQGTTDELFTEDA